MNQMINANIALDIIKYHPVADSHCLSDRSPQVPSETQPVLSGRSGLQYFYDCGRSGRLADSGYRRTVHENSPHRFLRHILRVLCFRSLFLRPLSGRISETFRTDEKAESDDCHSRMRRTDILCGDQPFYRIYFLHLSLIHI